MIDTTIQTELSACLEQLPVEKQRQVLEFARNLVSRPPQGGSGRDLLKFAGTIDKATLEAMEKAIEEGCGANDNQAS